MKTDETHSSQLPLGRSNSRSAEISVQLNCRERIIAIVSGVVVFLVGGVMLFFPPKTYKAEFVGSAPAKIVSETKDLSSLLLLLGGMSGALLLFGLNGLRLAKFSAGPVALESYKEHERVVATLKDENSVPVENNEAETSPEPAAKPQDYVLSAGEDYEIYSLDGVPLTVLADLLSKWPSEYSRPQDLSSFEFAARKRGQGNHPWTVKFRDIPKFRIAYGGRGKETGTVTG